MADLKISGLTHGATVDAAADLVPFVDVSDTTQGAGGSTRYAFPGQFKTTDAGDLASGVVALARGGTGADLSATGGAGRYVKQSGAGDPLSVGVITTADLPTTGLTIQAWETPIGAAADGATVTFDLATHSTWKVTLGGDRTLALANASADSRFTVLLYQDGAGSRSVTWFDGISWSGNTPPTLTATANKADVFTFIAVGSGAYFGFVAGQNF